MYMTRCSARLIGGALCCFALAASAHAQVQKRFFVGPSVHADVDEFKKLFEPGAPWTFVQHQATFFDFPIDTLRPKLNPSYVDDATLSKAVKVLADAGLKVGVETGGLRSLPGFAHPNSWIKLGEVMAKQEGEGYQRWVSLGGRVDLIMFDSPISNVQQGLGMPWDIAAHELADYLDFVEKFSPGFEFGLIEPVPHFTLGTFPTFNPKKNFGDIGDLLSTVVPILEARGHRPSFFLADSPFTNTEKTVGGWRKLQELQRIVSKMGMRYGHFVNDNEGGDNSEEVYFLNSVSALDRLRQNDIEVDDFNFRSWYDYPKKSVPETKGLTFTGIVRQLLLNVYRNFKANNTSSVTIAFHDQTIEPLEVLNGSAVVFDDAMELREPAELMLPRLLYAQPHVAIETELQGMLPGSRLEVIFKKAHVAGSHRVALVTRDDGLSHVELRYMDAMGASSILMRGTPVPLDPLVDRVLFSVRVRDGRIEASVNRNVSLDALSPLPEESVLGVASASDAPFVGRARVYTLDAREGDAISNVSFDKDHHVLFSVFRRDLLSTFEGDYWLNTFSGDLVGFDEFSTAVFPVLETIALRNDYVVMRSVFPVSDTNRVGLVYDGDFETAGGN